MRMAPRSGFSCAGQHAEQRRLAGAIRADHPDNAAGRQGEVQALDQQPVVIALAQILDLDDRVAEPLARRNDDLGRSRAQPLLVHPQQFVIGLDARLRLGLPRLGRGGNPLLLALEHALARRILARFLGEALGLFGEIGRIIALIGDAAAAIELENPAGDIVEEVAVMGDDQDGARIGAEMVLEPVDRFGIEMVGRLVEQQEVGLAQQELGQGHPPLLAAGQPVDRGGAGRAAQRIHRLLDLGIEIPQVLRIDDVLELRGLVGILFAVVVHEGVVLVEHRLLGRHPLHDIAHDVERRVELRLLWQIADTRPFGHPGLARELAVETGHDAQQRRLAGTVRAEHADLGIGVEVQVNVLQDFLAAGIGLGQPLHVIDELTRHRPPLAVAIVSG